jgi:hypothetical protein
MSHAIAAHAVIKSPLNAFQNPSCSQRILQIALTSHVTRLVELQTAHYDSNSAFAIRIRIAIGSQFLA